MSLADEYVKLTVPIAEGVRNRILILDVERLDGISQQHWWDRGDLKNRYIHYETVVRQPRTTIVCAKWYDSPDVIRLAEWDKGGRKAFLRKVHRLMESADIIVGHNVDNADIPWLKGDLHIEAGLPPLPPFKTVDTLKVLRKQFKSGAPFKGLDAFCQIVGIAAKTDRYDREAMERAVTGKSVEDRERLTDYCVGDVVATQGLFDFLRPHITNHPALFMDGKNKLTTCHRCGNDTNMIARRYVANIMTYSMRKCTACGGYSRISIEPERLSIVRGV
jgi:hypothetical protein